MSKHPIRKPVKPAKAPAKAPTKKTSEGTKLLWPFVASAAVLVYGLYRAIDLRWICDDAFITMRYVKNFVEGNGLVYNIGERVEGYTHFLWLMVLAASKEIGFDPVDASMWLGIVFYAGILLLMLSISFKEQKKNPKLLWLPLGATLFALNYDAAVWASGGLETSFYTLLILASFYLWFYTKFPERTRLLSSGTVLALVALTRPDGVLFTATAAALLVIRGVRMKQHVTEIMKPVGFLILPSVVIGVPYLLWKLSYYGDILPLTYYAKSANQNYFDQGFFYIWLYFRVYFISGIALLAGTVLLLWPRKDRTIEERNSLAPSYSALIAIAVYLILFVARVGGDFMFARFIVPIVPFVYLVIERAMGILTDLKKQVFAIVLLLILSFASAHVAVNGFFRFNDNGDRVEDWNSIITGTTKFIADERWFYYDPETLEGIYGSRMEIYSNIGKYLEPYFKKLPFNIAIPGSMNMLAYYGNFAKVIDEFGLTDSTIAHGILANRGHVGHEKHATDGYLKNRKIDIELGKIVPVLPNPLTMDMIALHIMDLNVWQLGRVVVFDSTLMNALSCRFDRADNDSRLPLYQIIIPIFIKHTLPQYSLSQLEDQYEIFQECYFNHYPDSALQQPFKERLAELKLDSAKGKAS